MADHFVLVGQRVNPFLVLDDGDLVLEEGVVYLNVVPDCWYCAVIRHIVCVYEPKVCVVETSHRVDIEFEGIVFFFQISACRDHANG